MLSHYQLPIPRPHSPCDTRPTYHTEVLILGRGLVGLKLALALGIRTVAAHPAKTLSDSFDGRASAIASASWRMLEAIGIAERPKPRRVPSGGSGCVKG